MFAWPAIERRFTGDHRRHDLLDRPRDRPIRTAIGAAFLSWVVIIFAIGSTDRLFFRLSISYKAQIHFWRIGVWVIPIVVFFITRSACRSLARSESHPLRAWQGEVVRRRPDGSVELLAHSPDRTESPISEPPVGTVPGHEPAE
jgi:ubiquinol-cytochrome c reductase cytochrome b subunit